jgi:predicted permease
MEQGLSEEEARRRAAASFGDVHSISSDLKQERLSRNKKRERQDWLTAARMDARYAIRSLRNHGSFTAAAVATLALGLGATLAVFTVVNGVLVRPLPYKDPARITQLWISQPENNGGISDLPLTSGFFADLARDATSFETLAAFRSWPYALTSETGERERISGARVSPALFDVLGVRPMLGQPFGKEAELPGGPRVAMISYSLWERRFGREANVIGKQVNLGGESFTIVAVMPPGFSFPRGAELPAGLQFAARTDLWTPLVFEASDLRNYGLMNLSAVGKVRAGITLQAAQAEASGVMRRFLAANAPKLKLDYHLVPMAQQASKSVSRGLMILLGAVGLLLLIACANVTSLLIARGRRRRRELAVRAALGAGRGRIARQLITENVVLAIAGGTLGMAIAHYGTKGMLALVPGSMPRADDIGIDWRVTTVAVLMTLIAGALFGVASAHTVQWKRLAGELHAGDNRSTTDQARRLGRQMLVMLEVAMSVILLIGAALLTRTFVRLQSVPPGFNAENVLVAGASMPIAGAFNPVRDGPKWAATFNQATARLGSASGIVSAGAVSSLPLSGAIEGGGVRIPGRTDPPGQGPRGQYSVVSGDYFKTLQIRVVAGRAFDSSDDAPGAGSIIVNQEFVRKYLTTDAQAVNGVLIPWFTFTPNKEHRIVGVVENIKQQSLSDEPTPQVYVPESQLSYPGMTFVLRTSGDPRAAVAMLRRELNAVDPSITLGEVRTLQDVLETSLAKQRFSMTLIGVFAACALVLALSGLYGVVALIVGQRNREIGVRLALGALPRDVVRMVVLEGSRVNLAGIAIGLLGAFALTRVLGTLLYGVSPTDAAAFVGATALVLIVSTAAALVPARRASRVDPTVTLRSD